MLEQQSLHIFLVIMLTLNKFLPTTIMDKINENLILPRIPPSPQLQSCKSEVKVNFG